MLQHRCRSSGSNNQPVNEIPKVLHSEDFDPLRVCRIKNWLLAEKDLGGFVLPRWRLRYEPSFTNRTPPRLMHAWLLINAATRSTIAPASVQRNVKGVFRLRKIEMGDNDCEAVGFVLHTKQLSLSLGSPRCLVRFHADLLRSRLI